MNRIREALEVRKHQMSDAAFVNTTRKLSEEARDLVFEILGGISLPEAVAEMARRDFLRDGSKQLTGWELAAAKEKTLCLLDEITGRFWLSCRE